MPAKARLWGSILCVGFLAAHSAFADPPPVEAYAAIPARDVTLSPDGQTLAYIGAYKGHPTVITQNIDSGKKTTLPFESYAPNWVFWKSPTRLVISIRKFGWIQNDGWKDVAEGTRLVGVDANGTNMIDLVNDAGLMGSGDANRLIQDSVVSHLPDDPDHILINFGNIDKVDVNRGTSATLDWGIGHLVGNSWIVDSHGAARIFGDTLSGDMITHFKFRESENAPWQPLADVESNRGSIFRPVAFDAQSPQIVYVMSDHEGGAAGLYAYDAVKGSFVRTLAHDPLHETIPIVRDGALSGFYDGSKTVYIDPGWEKDFQMIGKAMPRSSVGMIDRSADGSRTLVRVQQANGPESYWLLDRTKGKPELKIALGTFEQIADDDVMPVKEIHYTSRDGLSIPAFLTLPKGAPPGPIPFVVLPHGGPWANDNPFYGFDWWAQFLASRGYGVLQPQFRGSTGQGATFERAGFGQWGLAMQDDVTDGTRWLIDQKLADPDRIAIVGGSYGGYAALQGVIREPALYRCAVAWAPVTNVLREAHHLNRFMFTQTTLDRLPQDDTVLRAISPDVNAEKITVPVLLAHGKQDFIVNVADSERMENALKEAGKPVETLYLPDADHFLSFQQDRLAFMQAMENFLAAHIVPLPTEGKGGAHAVGG